MPPDFDIRQVLPPPGTMLRWASPPYNKAAVQTSSRRGNWLVRFTADAERAVLCFDINDASGSPSMPVPVGTFGSMVEAMIAAQCIHARLGHDDSARIHERQDMRKISWLGKEDTLVRATDRGTFMLVDEGYSTDLVYSRSQKLDFLGTLRFRARPFGLPGADGKPAGHAELRLIELAALVEIMDFRLTLGSRREASRFSAEEWDQWLDTRFIPTIAAPPAPADVAETAPRQMEMAP